MLSSFKKTIFMVLSVFLCVRAAQASSDTLPNPLYVNADNPDYIVTKKTRVMEANGFCEIRIPGAIERSPYNQTYKIQHPKGSGSEYKKAAIYIIAHVAGGDTDRLSSEFSNAFNRIARLEHPYVYRHLINEESLPENGAWKGAFAPPDVADGVHMSIGDEPFKQMRRETFISGLANYYNASPTQSLVLDLLDPRTDSSVVTTVTGNVYDDNGAYKLQSVALNPADSSSSLPAYDSSTAPFGVETTGGEKALHVPLSIGCKTPTITYFYEKPTIQVKAFLVVAGTTKAEDPCKVLLEGDNSYVDPTTMDFCIYRGGTAVITTAASLPLANIVIDSTAVPADPTTDYRNSTLTFPDNFASMTVFTVGSGLTLKMLGSERASAEIVVTNNVTLDVTNAKKDVGVGSSLVIEAGGRAIW